FIRDQLVAGLGTSADFVRRGCRDEPGREYLSHARTRVAASRLKRREVVTAANQSRGGTHRVSIEGADDMPRVAALKRIEDVGVPDPIAIHLQGRVEPCVKGVGRDFGVRYPNGVGQPRVQRANESPRFNLAREGGACDLPPRARAGMGASGTDDGDLTLIELSKRLFEQSLDGCA